MPSANQHWTSFQNLDTVHSKKVEAILQRAGFFYLCTRAIYLRGQEPTALTYSVDRSKFPCGRSKVVFALDFSDSVQWVVRILLPQDEENQQHISNSMMSEVATMKLVSRKTSLPVPQVFAYDVTVGNPFGYTYLLMEALPGKIGN